MKTALKADSRILILYAHPSSEQSRANRALAAAARALPNVRVHDLYEAYPDFYIGVQHEQQSLAAADLIVFQHPIQWYGMPSLLKEWVDTVLEYGWAYGAGGSALRGKDFWLAATTGSPQDSYREGGRHGHDFSAFLPPFRQTARLCGMRWRPPHILHGADQVDEHALARHVEAYQARLRAYPDWPDQETAQHAHHGSGRPDR